MDKTVEILKKVDARIESAIRGVLDSIEAAAKPEPDRILRWPFYPWESLERDVRARVMRENIYSIVNNKFRSEIEQIKATQMEDMVQMRAAQKQELDDLKLRLCVLEEK